MSSTTFEVLDTVHEDRWWDEVYDQITKMGIDYRGADGV